MPTYTAAIATEASVVTGAYCDVAVIINDDSQPEPQLGSDLAMEPLELAVRTDDPDKLVKVEDAAVMALAAAGWKVTGPWSVADNALYADVAPSGTTARESAEDAALRARLTFLRQSGYPGWINEDGYPVSDAEAADHDIAMYGGPDAGQETGS
jgi:hypothetical protein